MVGPGTVPDCWSWRAAARQAKSTFSTGEFGDVVQIRFSLHAADIPDKLPSLVDFKAGQREGVPEYKMLNNALQKKTAGGQMAVSIEAEFDQDNVKMIEYNTWMVSQKTHAYLCARVRVHDFASVQPRIDMILATFSVP
jgi:hypothetical protein